MNNTEELIIMLKILKEQALKSCKDTAVIDVNIDSFNFVINEAIKALEQESSDDCISRAEVLQMIEDTQNAGGFIGCYTYSEAFDRVDNMPPIKPTHKTCKDCEHWKESLQNGSN